VVLHCTHKGDIAIERHGFTDKAKMFVEVFGLNIRIAS